MPPSQNSQVIALHVFCMSRRFEAFLALGLADAFGKPLHPCEHSIIIMPIHRGSADRNWAAFPAKSILMASNVPSYHARMLFWVILNVKAFQLHELIEPKFT